MNILVERRLNSYIGDDGRGAIMAEQSLRNFPDLTIIS